MEQKANKATHKFIWFIITILAITYIAISYSPYIVEVLKDAEKTRDIVIDFGFFGFALFLLMQIIQVILAVIPGDIVNFAGGYIYGVPLGFLLSYIGIMVGTVIIFYISRILGYDFIVKFIKKEKIDKMSEKINSVHGTIGLLIICLIPFLPKDLMIYAAGLTPIKATRLFFVYGISRIPGTLIWTAVGASTHEQNYLNVAIVLTLLAILFVIGYIYRDKINKAA